MECGSQGEPPVGGCGWPSVKTRPPMRPRCHSLLAPLLALAALVLPLAVPAAPAYAAITFVQNLGTGTGTGTSITITTTGAVTAGHSIIVSVATNNNGTTITCSDPVNGAYATDVQG